MEFSFAFIRAVKIHHFWVQQLKENHGLEDILSFQVMDDNFEITFLI